MGLLAPGPESILRLGLLPGHCLEHEHLQPVLPLASIAHAGSIPLNLAAPFFWLNIS